MRKLAVLIALFVLASAFPAIASNTTNTPSDPLSYDDHLVGHEGVPALQRAERFIAS